ncbi:MAG TPA: hypothetical protein VKZ89_14880 [Thermobifida alba]|nr:hypothetical protein [Thermobifida alba]
MPDEAERPRTAPNVPDDEHPLEAPEADVVDQRTADDEEESFDLAPELERGWEVPEADAVEQALEVPEDEDDYYR